MSYELEPFGIKVVMVEPGVIRTNFVDGLVVAKKSQDANSPYSQIMQKIAAGSDVETWLGGKRKVADEELYKMMNRNPMT